MQAIKDIKEITQKDLKEFIRDRLRLITFFIMPIFMMLLVGFIFPNQNSLKNIPLGIAVKDKGEAGKQLFDIFEKLKTDKDVYVFEVKRYTGLNEIKEGIKKQEISGGVLIPENFTRDLAANKQVEIVIIEDQSNPQISAAINQTISRAILGFSKQISIHKLNLIINKFPYLAPYSAYALLNPILTKLEGIVPGATNYFEFVAPGIMIMVVMTAVLTGLAASVSREKEQGTLDGILIAPINRLAIILGKALAQSIRGIVQGVIVLVLAILLFGVKVYGSLILVLVVVILSVFSFVGLGILVSAIASEQETATQLLFMFQFPMLFLSGVFFPIQQMPQIMQKIAYLLPLTYGVMAMRKVIVLGATLPEIKREVFILLTFGAITLAVSVPAFKKIITR